jgi:MFS family permease
VSAESAAAVAEEAIVDGDVAIRPGTARSALRSRDLRRLWYATFASNIGTWMQNVALGAFAYRLEHSASFVAYVGFAQLGPVLLLAPVGGLLADVVDRRKLLVLTNLEQLVFSIALAFVAGANHPSKLLLFVVVVAIGIGNALSGPPLSSLLPNLVPREDLPGAVSLQSVQMNLSRVVGPAIAGVLLPAIHASGVFAINAGTYLFAVAGALAIRPVAQVATYSEGGVRRLLGGVVVAREDPVIRSVLLVIAAISFFCLPFIGLMPAIGGENLHLNVNGLEYGLMYASFGLGAAGGAIAVGSVLSHRPREPIIAISLALFGIALAGFGFLHNVNAAYPIVFLVGLFYFTTVTSLSTRLQEQLDDTVRGRVMALYMMGFGGTVPLGLLVGGQIADASSVSAVVIGGGAIGVVLALAVRPRRASGR